MKKILLILLLSLSMYGASSFKVINPVTVKFDEYVYKIWDIWYLDTDDKQVILSRSSSSRRIVNLNKKDFRKIYKMYVNYK